jgi:transketolase
MKALRNVYGETLLKLGDIYDNLVVLDADLSKSTKTDLFGVKFPERFFNMGISEQDMFATAAGMAAAGALPFASTFAIFSAGRAYEQIRNSICYPKLNVKIVATHAGITVGEDGATHQMLEDIGLMRSLPNMKVFVPSDAIETEQVIKYVASIVGPVYVRLPRIKLPDLLPANYKYNINNYYILQDGKDVAILTAGVTLTEVVEAEKLLKKDNIKVTIVNLSTIKPINIEFLKKISDNFKFIITVEEHNVFCGLGSAVAEVISAFGNCNKLKIIGIQDTFGESGDSTALLKKYGIDAVSIYNKIKKFID